MGRIKTQQIKRLTHQLMRQYRGSFKDNFDENKHLVTEYLEGAGKKIRNTVAGYITRQVRRKDDYA